MRSVITIAAILLTGIQGERSIVDLTTLTTRGRTREPLTSSVSGGGVGGNRKIEQEKRSLDMTILSVKPDGPDAEGSMIFEIELRNISNHPVEFPIDPNLGDSDIYWNEALSPASCENGSNWCNYQIESGGGDTNPLQDMLDPPLLNVNPAPSPTPTCSGQGNGATRYRSIPQVINVGSSDTGQGVQAQSDTLGYYIDHGQHDSIQTPSQPPQ